MKKPLADTSAALTEAAQHLRESNLRAIKALEEEIKRVDSAVGTAIATGEKKDMKKQLEAFRALDQKLRTNIQAARDSMTAKSDEMALLREKVKALEAEREAQAAQAAAELAQLQEELGKARDTLPRLEAEKNRLAQECDARVAAREKEKAD